MPWHILYHALQPLEHGIQSIAKIFNTFSTPEAIYRIEWDESGMESQ
jgi:hypothetical protein